MTGLRVQESPEITHADLVALQAAATARATEQTSGPIPLGVRMPASVRAALGKDGAFNPKIHESNVKQFRRGEPFDLSGWQSAVRAAAKKRGLGDVLESTINQAAGYLAWLCRAGTDRARGAQGSVQVSFAQWSNGVGRGCSVATACKIARWLEDAGLINTFNTLQRIGRRLLRGANNYVLVMGADARVPDAAPESTADAPPALRRLRRFNAWLSRWEKAFGLVVRPWGLNATPVATHRFAHLPADERPAPA